MRRRYMHDSGAQWDEMVPMAAAGAGAIGCMEYALGMVGGISISLYMCCSARLSGVEAVHVNYQALHSTRK